MQTFASAAADVNEHFSTLIAMLFPGGQGRLVLTEPDDLLNTGVEIEVRPAGRNVRRVSLLSGGERSMAALAFLFAVFRSRPSPFYLMDEVEAALDDVNLHRFLGLVDEFRDEAQLLIVSHQKRTMETADALYGVTMKPGRLVPGRLPARARASQDAAGEVVTRDRRRDRALVARRQSLVVARRVVRVRRRPSRRGPAPEAASPQTTSAPRARPRRRQLERRARRRGGRRGARRRSSSPRPSSARAWSRRAPAARLSRAPRSLAWPLRLAASPRRARRRSTREISRTSRRSLLGADVGVATTDHCSRASASRGGGRELDDVDGLLGALRTELLEHPRRRAEAAAASTARCAERSTGRVPVWLFVGVNGVGKTTTIGKLAAARVGRRALASCSRPATPSGPRRPTSSSMWAERTGAEIVRGAEGGDPECGRPRRPRSAPGRARPTSCSPTPPDGCTPRSTCSRS